MAQGTKIGSLFYTLGIDTTGLQKDSQKVQGALSGLFNPAILGTAALGGALLKLGGDALAFSRDFETAFAEVQTISESARMNADSMRESILKMTEEIPVEAVDSTKALYQIVSAGFDGAEAMNILEISAKAAVAGVSNTATAADTLTTIINAYGMTAGDAMKVSDALFKTVELGKTTLSEIGSSFSQVASIAASYNIQVNDVLAGLASITKQGASTGEAVTRLRGAIVALAKEFGPSIFEGRSLGEAFQFAREQADKSGKTYEEFFGRVEASTGILQLTGKNAIIFAEALDKINKSAGATEGAFEVMNDTLEKQEKLFKNKLNVIASRLGDFLLGIEKEILPGLNRELETLTDDTIPGYAKALSALANAFNFGLLFGGRQFTAEDFSPETVRFIKDAEREVVKFTNKTKDLSDERFKVEVENIKKQRAINIKSFNELQERKQKGFQFDKDALNEAERRNVIYYKLLESAEKRLAEIREKGKEEKGKEETTPKKVITPKITLSSLKQELKSLKDDLEHASKSEVIGIKVKIRAKENEIKDFLKGIEDRLEPISIKIKEQTPKLGEQSVKLSEKQTKEYKKQNAELAKIRSTQKDNASLTQSQIPKAQGIANTLMGVTNVMDELAGLASLFDESLADAVTQVADLVDGFAGLAEGIASKNPFAIAASSIKIISAGIKIFSGQARAQKEAAQAAEALRQKYEMQNRQLERQIKLLSETSGKERIKQEQVTLDLIQSQIDALNAEADQMEVVAKKRRYGFLGIQKSSSFYTDEISNVQDLIDVLEGSGEAAASLQNMLAKGYTLTNGDRLNEIIDKYDELIKKRTELYEALTQTSTEDIADSILEGFESGKSGIEDFADDFESLMKKAILESFKTQFLLNASKSFFDKFGDLARGGLTTDEIKSLRGSFSELVTNASKEFESLNEVFKGAFGEGIASDPTSENGIAGAIGRAITEDTATELQGIWNRSLFETIEQTAILNASNGYLSEIAVNTARSAIALESLDSKISSDSTDRDTGNII